jgi:hypothetical protein
MNSEFIIGDSLHVQKSRCGKYIYIREICQGDNEFDLDLDVVLVPTKDIPRLILALIVLYLTNLRGTLHAT